jgi:hypothetical protein
MVGGHSKCESFGAARIVHPATEQVAKVDSVYCVLLGPDPAGGQVKLTLGNGIAADAVFVSTDAKRWEDYVWSAYAWAFFRGIGKAFNLSEKEVNTLATYFTACGFMGPQTTWLVDGDPETEGHGVSSGSGFTWLLNSIIHRCLVELYCSLFDVRIIGLHIGGDDGLYVLDSFNAKHFAEWAQERGFTFEPEGMIISRDGTCKFLQYLYDPPNGVYMAYPLPRVVGHAGRYEMFRDPSGADEKKAKKRTRKSWSGREDTLRWLSQCSNAIGHPKFKELLAQFIQWDEEYRMGLKAGSVKRFIATAVDSPFLERHRQNLKSMPWSRSLDNPTTLSALEEVAQGAAILRGREEATV